MLDQMFTAENFRRIYDVENRKGLDLANFYFPQLDSFTLNVREKVREIKDLRKIRTTLTNREFDERLLVLKNELKLLKTNKSLAIDNLMEEVSQKALESSFKIKLSKKLGPNGKEIYCIDESPQAFFVIKQIQLNIQRIYGVKQANRHALVCQLRDMLENKFPFEFVRTDISSFYESIDRKRLLGKLESDQLLSPMSKKYIKQVLESYGQLSNSSIGVPRGVGISAYLAELYLRAIDKEIRAISGLVLYCRFVDDIVVFFARSPIGEIKESAKDLIQGIFQKNGLEINPEKTSEFNISDSNSKKFEYLGYRFYIDKHGKLEISPSARKIIRYRRRLDAAFTDYWREKPVNSRGAYRKLVARIKFLTGNTRLTNSKSAAATGIYFNNSIVTNMSCFRLLDLRLKKRILELRRSSLQRRLKKFQFTSGFQQRRYHNFSTRELQMIVKSWKYD